METDIRGRLIKFPLSVEKPLMPLFEAITNSMQAIKEAKQKNGIITIHIRRDNGHRSLREEAKAIPPVIGFSITDNGIGFNDVNYNSFSRADSTYKLSIGGKGVGRFTFLKVFDGVEIRSLFSHDKTLKQRVFSFTLDDVKWDGCLHDTDASSTRQSDPVRRRKRLQMASLAQGIRALAYHLHSNAAVGRQRCLAPRAGSVENETPD